MALLEGESSLFKNEFVSITRHRFLSSCQIVVSKKLWRFFDAVRGLYNVMANAFIRGHSSISRSGDYIIVAEETEPFNMLINLSRPFLTRVSTLN